MSYKDFIFHKIFMTLFTESVIPDIAFLNFPSVLELEEFVKVKEFFYSMQ